MILARLTAVAALLAATGTVSAQMPPDQLAPAKKPAAPTPRVANYPGVSAAGNAIIGKMEVQSTPGLRAILVQQKDVQGQISALALAPTIDVDKLGALLKQGEALQGQFRTRFNDRLIATLKALPEADRSPFLKAIGSAPRSGQQ